jgi:hypothetical protein
MVGFVALNLAALGVLLAYTTWLAYPPSEAAPAQRLVVAP